MPGIFPDTPATGLPPGGEIRPGETSLQAAARRYYERKRRESAESGGVAVDSNASHSVGSPTGQLPPVPDVAGRGLRDSLDPWGSGVEMPQRRRSSMSERWHEFMRHLP
ncbi:hypothetical protein BDW62DRAFT_200463 [Aspergillus aurantiobrunneus]